MQIPLDLAVDLVEAKEIRDKILTAVSETINDHTSVSAVVLALAFTINAFVATADNPEWLKEALEALMDTGETGGISGEPFRFHGERK